MYSVNKLIIASAVIERDGKILLVQQGGSTNYGRWNVPSGKVERGESVVEALAREVLEETGLEVEVAEPYAVYRLDLPDKRGGKIVYGCRAIIVGGQLQLRREEILDARWFPISQIMQMPDERLCNPRDLRKGLRDYLLVYSTSICTAEP